MNVHGRYRCWLFRSNISRLGNGKARFVPLKWVAAGSGFSLIFSLTAKAWPKPTEHQTAQYTAPAAQKMTVKHGKTGLETRKTGSSPVLSTIKLNQKRYQREKPRSFNDFRVFLRPIFEVEKKISKRVLAKSVDLNLYPRHFEPLFREFFGKAARFCSRKNVEFRPTFLVALPNTHSKHRFQRVSQLCDVSDVKTAGKPPPAPGRNHSVLAMLGREKAKHPLPVQRVVVYLLALSRASVFNVTPIMSLWASRLSRQSGDKKVNAF